MALIKCPECGGQVSDKASACIHCGCPLSSNTVNAVSKKFYVDVDGHSYDMTELKEMYQAYSPEDQELIYQYCKSTFKKYPTSYNYQALKDCGYRGLDLIQYVKENLKWPDVKAYLTYKFIAKCYKKNFDSFSFKTDKYKPEEYNRPQPTSNSNVVRCPRCGSTSVATEKRGFDPIWGFLGSDWVRYNVCQKCGHRWKIGR